MPVHNWTRVKAGIFHDFHTVWIGQLRTALNAGLLTKNYYALAEQHSGRSIADVLTLHSDPQPSEPEAVQSSGGGLAVAEAPPKVRRKLIGSEIEAYKQRRRTIAIRHVSGHRLVAMIKIASPANKDRVEEVQAFAGKAFQALSRGIHLVVVDLFPPTAYDPLGLHGAIWDNYAEEPYEPPADEPLTVVSYAAARNVEPYVEHLAVGGALPECRCSSSRIVTS